MAGVAKGVLGLLDETESVVANLREAGLDGAAATLSPLANVSATRAVLDAHGLSTKYSFGQNFLVNDAIVRKIIQLAGVTPRDSVLEVGPGIGTLTIALLKTAGFVTSVEIDADLPAVLNETCAPWADRFRLIQKDALHLLPSDVERKRHPATTTDGCLETPTDEHSAMPVDGDVAALPNKLVANLPYAVAATVVLGYFQQLSSLESATVMVQKEVADRMCASPGTKNYGAYTVKLRLFARPAGRFAVGPGNFFPPPRVESSVIRLDRCESAGIDGSPASRELVDAACLMADAAFASRRKTIANSCKTFFAGRGEAGAAVAARIPELLAGAGIEATRRGETLELEEFIRLGSAYVKLLEGRYLLQS